MIDRVAVKARAKEFAFNNKWNIWKCVLLVSIISGIGSGLSGFISGNNEVVGSLITIIVGFAMIPLEVGAIDYFVNLVRGKKVNLTESLLKFYKSEYLWNVIKIEFIAGLIIFALSLLFIIPGIIWALKYAMINYIIVDKSAKELENSNVREESTKMMDGHKWEFVIFQLSFILWYMLGSITLGIAMIWVLPYVTTASVMWYDELKKLSK